MNVIGYVRVSTEEQATTGVSLDAQEDKIRAYCDVKDWKLIDVIRDEGISAKDLKRPGMQSILYAIGKKNRPFDGIVVHKLDRLTRSVRDLGILNELFQKHHITFVSIQEAVDTSTATGQLFHNIVVSISEWERKVISERTKTALSFKKKERMRTGEIPYGYKLDKDGKLISAPVEQTIIGYMRDRRAKGFSYGKIAAMLNADGIKTKKGSKWYPATVHSILAHAV